MPKETKEVLLRKIERIKVLLNDLEALLDHPFVFYENNKVSLRAAERNFELMVELASDINTSLILDKTGQTPDSYREAFSQLSKLGFEQEIVDLLVDSAKMRNVLVHEYDFESDDKKFYETARGTVQAYKAYMKFIYSYVDAQS